MARLAAPTAIAAAVMAAIAALALRGPALLIAVAVAVAAGVILILLRGLPGWIGGALAIVLALVGAMGAVGAITGDGGRGIDFAISEGVGTALIVAALLVVPLTIIWWSWGLLPMWSVAVGGVGAVAAIALGFANIEGFGGVGLLTILVAVAALAAGTPAVVMARSPETTAPAPGTSARRTDSP